MADANAGVGAKEEDSLSEQPPQRKPSEFSILLSGFRRFGTKNFLPLAFAVAFIVALSWPWLGQQVVKPEVLKVHVVSFVIICFVFLISGLGLKTDELKDVFSRRTVTGTVFALFSILGLTPLLGFATRELGLQPAEFATGLTLFCIVPTTLGVGVSLVTSAKGNVALAILLTVGSNAAGVIFIPLWLKAMLSSASGVQSLKVDFWNMFVKLLISCLVPTVIGKAIREFVPGAIAFQKNNKVRLSVFSNTLLAILIWQTLSAGRDQIVNTAFGEILLLIIITLGIHVFYLLVNWAAVKCLRVPLCESIAVVIIASQKSAPIAITVITYLSSDPAVQGVLALPCVIGQLIQIFVGQPIANHLAAVVERNPPPPVEKAKAPVQQAVDVP